jgi:hypothetical protein
MCIKVAHMFNSYQEFSFLKIYSTRPDSTIMSGALSGVGTYHMVLVLVDGVVRGI